MPTNPDLIAEVEEGRHRTDQATQVRVYSKLLDAGSRAGRVIDIAIKMHRSDDAADYDNDPNQSTGTGTTDANGIVNFYWTPDAISPLTDRFLYYAYVTLDADPTTYAVSNEFYALSKREFMKYDSTVPLRFLQSIPVYEERSRNLDGGTIFPFTYPNWLRDPVPTATKRLGDTITALAVTTDFTVNYDTGKLTLVNSVTAGTEIFGSYKFKYFSSDVILSSLDDATQWLNSYARKDYNSENFPDFWNPYVKAYVVNDLIESVWSSLLFREQKLIFAEEGTVEALQAIYTANATMLTEAQKRARRPSDFTPRVVTGGDVISPFRNLANSYFIYSATGIHR